MTNTQCGSKKSSIWSHWPLSDKKDPFYPCNCEKHCRGDTRRWVKQTLSYAIYTPSFTSAQKYVYAKYWESLENSQIYSYVSAILQAGMSYNRIKIIYSNKIIVNSCDGKISNYSRKYIEFW